MDDLTRSEKILAEKTVCIVLLRGKSPEGVSLYAYVGVRADKLKAFVEAQNRGIFQPEDHGIVIESGEGEPSPQVRARMEHDYGFDHAAMQDVPDAGHMNAFAAGLSKKANEKPE